MEADWEVEIGGQAPVIEAHWTGFIDLRPAPERAQQLPEAAQLPALADTLVRLNTPSSPVWTSKCDVWHPDIFDPDELDAPPGERSCAIACYVDLLPRRDQPWPDPEDGIAQDETAQDAIAACKSLCVRLRQVPLRCCRADLIVRQASIVPGLLDLGVTAYFTACGATSEDAAATLAAALVAFVDSMNIGHPGPCIPKLQ
jgi:hypothetical protein